jgi:hypothetical protein
VLVTTSPEWVYMLNLVEKWLCESQKKKTMVDLHLIRHFEVLKKKFFYDIVFIERSILIQSFNRFAIKLT